MSADEGTLGAHPEIRNKINLFFLLKLYAKTFQAKHKIAVDPEIGSLSTFHRGQSLVDSWQDADTSFDDFWAVVNAA